MANQPQRRFRPRISLLTALLLTTIVALALVVAMQWRTIGPLREDNRRLRAEVGELWIEDPSRVYAVEVPMGEDNVGRFRVYVPQGGEYYLYVVKHDIPRHGYPDDPQYSASTLQSGEMLIDVRIVDDGLNPGESRLIVRTGDGRIDSQFPGVNESDLNLQEGSQWQWSVSGIGPSQKSFEPDKRAELMRMRPIENIVFQRDDNGEPQVWESKPIEEPTVGVLIWIERRL